MKPTEQSYWEICQSGICFKVEGSRGHLRDLFTLSVY